MKKAIASLVCLALLCARLPALAESVPVTVTGRVAEIEKYGHALLDITIGEFNGAGFALGDIVTVSAGSYEGDMPCLNGYYVDTGEYMVRAYPGTSHIAVCVNYGRFAEAAGVGAGDPVTLTLREKGGALALQEINDLVYTDDRADYASDAEFANFRAVAEGRLYRSASPVDDRHGRAGFADALMREAGIRTVMNMADTDEEIRARLAADDTASPGYRALYGAGRVIALCMPVDYASDGFAEGIVRGLSFLAENEGPYLVHCTEGKDRAGFAVMLLGMLMGSTQEEIVADYMLSYVNYYHIGAGTEKYDMIAAKNVMEMMRSAAGLEKGADMAGVDWEAAAERYLLGHGMSGTAVRALKDRLK